MFYFFSRCCCTRCAARSNYFYRCCNETRAHQTQLLGRSLPRHVRTLQTLLHLSFSVFCVRSTHTDEFCFFFLIGHSVMHIPLEQMYSGLVYRWSPFPLRKWQLELLVRCVWPQGSVRRWLLAGTCFGLACFYDVLDPCNLQTCFFLKLTFPLNCILALILDTCELWSCMAGSLLLIFFSSK